MVPVFLAGRILGKSGETHQKIKKDTGCQLHFMENTVRFQDYYTYKLDGVGPVDNRPSYE